MRIQPFDAVIWDMNGVLLDDEEYQWKAFQRVLSGRGFHAPDEDFHLYCGVTEVECFASVLGTGTASEAVRECMTERRRIYAALLDGRLPLYPGAREAVDRVEQAGIAQAIASAACREEVMRVADELGAARFRAIVAAEDVIRSKPDPEVYRTAASRLGIDPASCLVIEDSYHGIEAARAAGMRCVGIASTLPRERLHRAGRVYDSLLSALEDNLFEPEYGSPHETG